MVSKDGESCNRGKTAIKLVLAIALVTGSQNVEVPSLRAVAAAASASSSIQSEEGAIQQARALGLLPNGAVVGQVLRKVSPSVVWELAFSASEKAAGAAFAGTIQLSGDNGEALGFTLNAGLEAIVREPGAPAFQTAKQKISYSQAVTIAEAFMAERTGALADKWLEESSPESAYSTRYESDAYHKIRYNSSYRGIRLAGSTSRVFIDRITGEVAACQLQWKKPEAPLQASQLTRAEAGRRLYDRMKVSVDAPPSGSKEAEPLFNLYGPLLIHAVTGKSDSSSPPDYAGSRQPTYPASLAKKRLLSLYDIELQYVNDGDELVYRLKLKPGVPLAYSGTEPFIGGITGKWQDYAGAPLLTEMPAASDWLLEAAASPEQITYKAGVVLNSQLVQLSGLPVVSGSRMLIPFRDLLEDMGAEMSWNGSARKVTARMSNKEVELAIGSSTAWVNGKAHALSAPAQLIDGKTYIPLRFAAEALGARVKWERGSRLAIIGTNSVWKQPSDAELAQLRFQQQLMAEELEWKGKSGR